MRKTIAKAAFLFAASAWLAAPAGAEPGVVFTHGGISDGSFNKAVHLGVERFRAETGIAYRSLEAAGDPGPNSALARMARDGADPIIAVGFNEAPILETVARDHPGTRFALIDGVVDAPNVRSILFREQEGFLVGLLAAMKSESGVIGFVGGRDVPIVRRFACGYAQGARFARPDVEILREMAGTTAEAWTDPERGAELARGQFARGADIVFGAAGGTGLGVYRAAAEDGRLAIAVDLNLNHLHPGAILTSMVKRVDIAAYEAFRDAHEGRFATGVRVLGLAEGGVGWALDEHNAALITPAMKAAAEDAEADIVAGRIAVHDYMADERCPAWE